MPAEFTLGFLGTGKMATALAEGVVRSGLVKPAQLFGSDPVASAREAFQGKTGGTVLADNAEVARRAEVLILAVKPDQVGKLLEDSGPGITSEHLVVSIVAGVTTRRIEPTFLRAAAWFA